MPKNRHSTSRLVLSGAASSIQAKASSISAAGQCPTRWGSGQAAASGSVPVARVTAVSMVRIGFSSRHTGPSSMDSSGTPIQNST